MSIKPALTIVPPAPAAATDIHALLRADIKARNWGRVHIAGDRREPVTLGPRITHTNKGRWYETRRSG